MIALGLRSGQVISHSLLVSTDLAFGSLSGLKVVSSGVDWPQRDFIKFSYGHWEKTRFQLPCFLAL